MALSIFSLATVPGPQFSLAQFEAPLLAEFIESDHAIQLPESEPFLELRRPPHPLARLTKAALDAATRVSPDEQGHASVALSPSTDQRECVAFSPIRTGLHAVRVQRNGESTPGEVTVLNESLCIMQPIWNDDRSWTSEDLHVWMRSQQTYYVLYRSQHPTLGPAQLFIDPIFDTELDLEPQPFELDENGEGKRCVRLRESTLREQFIVESPFTGVLKIELNGIGREVDPLLRVFDEHHELIDVSDDVAGSSSNAGIELFARAGQRFVVEASLYAGTGGSMWLNVHGVPHLTVEKVAQQINLEIDATTTQLGELSEPDQRDFYRFVAPFDGPLTIQLSSIETGELDAALSVFDEGQRLVGMDDDSLNVNDASLTFFLLAGRQYYVRAAACLGTRGPYRLDFIPGNAPTPFDQATRVRTHPSGYATLRNEITRDEPYRLYRLDSPTFCQFNVSMVNGMSSSLDSRLILFDQNQQPFAEADTLAQDGSASLRFESKPNEFLYLLATSHEESEGAFSLVVRRTDRISPFEHPRREELNPQHRLFVRDEFHLLREEKSYQFVSSVTGPLTAQCEGHGDDAPDVWLAVFDDAEQMIACNHGLVIGSFQESADAALSFEAKTGSAYTLLVGMDEARPGPFELTLGPGRLEGPFAHARELLFKDQTAVTVEGHADGSRRGHYYRFEGPTTGKISLIQRSVVPGEVDSLLAVYDHEGRELAFNDDTFGTDAAITLQAKEGETYFVRAGSYEGTHGDYRLSVAVGDLPGPFDDAIGIDLTMWSRWLRAGTLDVNRPIQYFRLTAPRFGKLVITMRAGAASDLDSLLVLYDEAGVEVNSSDDAFAGSLDAQLMQIARPDETYFVAVMSADDLPGAYEVGIEFEEMKDPFDIATPVRLQDGKFRFNGQFEDAASIAVFEWEPTIDGRYRVRLGNAGDDSTVDTLLSVFDQDRELIAMNDDASETQTDSELILEVRRGQTLYLQAGQYSGTAGNFSLLILPAPLEASSD